MTQQIAELAAQFPHRRSALIPALQLVQAQEGSLSLEALAQVAAMLELPPIEVLATSTFYSMFHHAPRGRHVIWVCKNLSCYLRGCDLLIDYLSRRLGVGLGETTADGAFTLLPAECLGACGSGPVLMLDDRYYENLTPEKVDSILAEVRAADAEASAGRGASGGTESGRESASAET